MVPLGIGRVLLWYLSNVLNKVTPDERKKRPSQDVDAEKYGTRLRPLLLIQTPGFFEARTYRTVRTMFECEPCKIYPSRYGRMQISERINRPTSTTMESAKKKAAGVAGASTPSKNDEASSSNA